MDNINNLQVEKSIGSAHQRHLIEFQEFFQQYVSLKYKKICRSELEDLYNTEFEVENVKPCEDIIENLPECYSEEKMLELESNIKKHIRLLQILVQKRSCPISRIIDAI